MNNLKLIAAFILSVVMLGSCNSDENFVTPAGSGERPSIHFKLGGSAKMTSPQSRAGYIEAEADECAVNTLYAMLFDTHKGFYKTVEARPVGNGEYDILIEDDATYDVWFVANPDADLLTKLENTPSDIQAADAVEYLQSVYASQQPKSEAGFLMRSYALKRVTTKITKTEDLGTVEMFRLAARFDIVNKAEDITVDKITFKNRAIKTTLVNINSMPEEDNWFETTTYTPDGLVGNKEEGAVFKHEIYSYRNISMDDDIVPVITLEYTENVDGKEVKRSHEVRLIDPNSPAGTPMKVQPNTLYTITLTKAYKLEFNVSVNDWNDTEELKVTELPIELDPDAQEELNRQLLVYDLFAPYNVKDLDISAKTATFFTELVNAKDYPLDSYFNYTTLDEAGLTAVNAVITVEGEMYRLPTSGELMLLMPFDYVGSLPNYSADMKKQIPVFAKSNENPFSTDEFTETVYMKNNEDKTQRTTEDYSDESVAFKGTSQLIMGETTATFHYNEAGFCTQEDATVTSSRYISYGIRFKGTKQYAAYRWQHAVYEDGIAYMSIRIKALPAESDLTPYDIKDNISFWKEGFIEIKVPYTGYRSYGTVGSSTLKIAYMNSSTSSSQNKNYYLGTNLSMGRVFTQAKTNAIPLRLVKVKQAAENE